MTPQSTFMILAPLAEGQEAGLCALLATMNGADGMADPANGLVPFGRFDRLHVARFVILRAETGADIGVYGIAPAHFQPSLAFLGDCDGPAETFLAELVEHAGSGLKQVFAHVSGFTAGTDLLAWMTSHSVMPAATYVNWIGRTVLQIREDAALRAALSDRVAGAEPRFRQQTTTAMCHELCNFVDAERKAGRLTLTPEAPTPLAWQWRNALHLVGVPLALLALLPFLLLASPLLLWRLRSLEKSDPEIAPRPDATRLLELAAREDLDITNQFSAFGDMKPGAFRLGAVMLFLLLLDYAARHVYKRGYLTRVQTIHFARWVLLDGNKRMFFASNYDGSLDSYMDDFINKVAWGINLVFSNGIGFPRTSWFLCGGAKFEQKYNRYLHRHQLPTAVWYKAYRGLSVADLNRNTRIRQGIDRQPMTESEAREWLSLL
ncbi:MAG TPA: hypothetical protein PLW68_06605 [Casimicrobiaceae bacterium]|nr:hypothetical protein [Casimicrobiaceae bacterium]